eukprot:GHUV01044284.1.p1 GENE.GHUV01044284.1~~GHUV01044284.1.p1  ORF type:complete len:138 (+),score=22.43 GHUV01044284.1:337-750(+)
MDDSRPEDPLGVLSQEILRKLRLATEAETKEDREIICEEVFCDISGQLEQAAKERLHIHHPGPVCFFEVLAPYYYQVVVVALQHCSVAVATSLCNSSATCCSTPLVAGSRQWLSAWAVATMVLSCLRFPSILDRSWL